MLNKDTLKTNNVRLSAIKAKLESLPEQKTVSPDFSKGNVIVEPSEGKMLTSVTIEKPETLTPDNIKLGTEIAGVLGTGGARVATGSFTPTKYDIYVNPVSITGLGFKPKYVCVRLTSPSTNSFWDDTPNYLLMIESGSPSGFIYGTNNRVYTNKTKGVLVFTFEMTLEDDGFTLAGGFSSANAHVYLQPYNYIAIG